MRTTTAGSRAAKAALAIAAVTALGLTGCSASPDNGGGEGSATSGNVNFVYKGSAATQAQWSAVFELFREQYPDIYLNARGIPSADWPTFANAVATQIAGGAQIDIVQVGTEAQRLFASKGILEPLDEFISDDQDVVDEYFADIDPNLVEWNTEYGSTDGKTYYMPAGYNTMVLYCNTSVFEEAGATLPEKDWTWDEFRAAAEQIKSATGKFVMPGASGYFTDVMPWLTTNGASTFNSDWSEPTFDTDAAIEAAEFAAGLVADGLASEPGGITDGNTQLAQGNIACLGGGRWPVNGLRTLEAIDDLRVVNWPTQTGNGSPVGWDGFPITTSSQNKDAAWTFIKFLMSQEYADFFTENGGSVVPARLSVATGPLFTANAPEGITLLTEAISFATPLPSPDRGAEAQTVIQEAWLNIISGNADAADELADANQKLADLLP